MTSLQHEMLPAKTMLLKSGEVTVSCYPSAPFCDREGCMLRVGNQFTRCGSSSAESHSFPEVRLRRDRRATSRMGCHLLDECERNRQRCRVLVDPAVGYDTNETDGDEHAQRERLNAVDKSLQPTGVSLMAFLFLPMRVNKDVDIGHQHYGRNRSRSSCSRAASKSEGSWSTRLLERP